MFIVQYQIFSLVQRGADKRAPAIAACERRAGRRRTSARTGGERDTKLYVADVHWYGTCFKYTKH